jgi:hypothetical protein
VEVRVVLVSTADLMTMISWLSSGFSRLTYSASASLSDAETRCVEKLFNYLYRGVLSPGVKARPGRDVDH